MKTKKLLKILVFSCLWIATPHCSLAQDALLSALIAETANERPSIGCFTPSWAGFHIRNDFCTKELMTAEISGQLNLRKNVIRTSVNHYGYANYGEMKLSLGYGRNFGDRFAMTARIFYLMAHARGYQTRHSLCADFGFACRLSAKVLLDATVYNPFMLRYGIVGQDVIPLKFSIGSTYMPVRKLLIALAMSKELPGTWEVGCRVITRPAPPLLLAGECSNLYLGIYVGWLVKQFLVSVRAVWHYRITVSPEIGGFYFDERSRL